VEKLKAVLVHKKSGDIIHATAGGSTVCGQVEGFDWRFDRILGDLDQVDCPSCRRFIEEQTDDGIPRRSL